MLKTICQKIFILVRLLILGCSLTLRVSSDPTNSDIICNGFFAPGHSPSVNIKEQVEAVCQNGGVCERVENVDDDKNSTYYKCNCQNTVTGVDNYVNVTAYYGYQCHYKAEVSCEINNRLSDYAFCLNEGVCTERVQTGQPHIPCECMDGYEGRHCQYAAGEAPEAELAYVSQKLDEYNYEMKKQSEMTTNPIPTNNNLTPWAKLWIVVFIMTVIAIMSLILIRRRLSIRATTNPSNDVDFQVDDNQDDIIDAPEYDETRQKKSRPPWANPLAKIAPVTTNNDNRNDHNIPEKQRKNEGEIELEDISEII